MKRSDFWNQLMHHVPKARAPMLAMCLSFFSAGCVSLENEEGRLPDAMRTAVTSLSAQGYPDLTKLPVAPTNMPSAATWTRLEAGLVAQGNQLATNPGAVALSVDESDPSWAQRERQTLEGDPRAQPLPTIAPGAEGSPEWAAAAKAKFDADLARLPPA